ncbi:MAG: SAM-dependent chlorinase/fluorinase [bacterium]
MPILTITTDWGLRDHYLAAFKGELFSLIPTLQLIDVSHEIEKFNTMQAAFIIQNFYHKFPEGTMHFIGLSSNENCNSESPFLIVRSKGQYLIGQDNGIFTLILGNENKEIVRLPFNGKANRNESYNCLLDTLKKLADGKNFETLGTVETTIEESYFALPTIDNKVIRGTIIYVDSFGNAVVNIKKELFEQIRKDRKFIIHMRKSIYNVTKISNSYEDVEVGEMLALFNQDGYLEIALNKESASKLLGLRIMEPIRIEFDDNQAG